jgi:hypothetical protein
LCGKIPTLLIFIVAVSRQKFARRKRGARIFAARLYGFAVMDFFGSKYARSRAGRWSFNRSTQRIPGLLSHAFLALPASVQIQRQPILHTRWGDAACAPMAVSCGVRAHTSAAGHLPDRVARVLAEERFVTRIKKFLRD